MIKKILNEDDDWIEHFRSSLYPRIHPLLEKFGGYGTGTVTESQYVTTVEISEEEFEKELVDIGFERNPIAAYKTHASDDRKSAGSWRLLPEDDPENGLDKGRQLHVTLLRSKVSYGEIDVYAHSEYNWEKHPIKHLKEKDFDVEWAVDHTRRLINEYSFVNNFQK